MALQTIKHNLKQKRVWLLAILTGCATAVIVTSCSHLEELKRNVKQSTNGSTESHNQGENCMRCHHTGGEAASESRYLLWNIGGTVYEADQMVPHGDGKLFLYTKPNRQGELKYVLEIDALGNVYTNQIINFGSGLYPYIVNSAGEGGMTEPIKVGTCNNCHGVTTGRIYTN